MLSDYSEIMLKSASVRRVCSRRKYAKEYSAKLPVIMRWSDESRKTAVGFTNKVATNSLSIVSSTYPPMGRRVVIDVITASPFDSEIYLRLLFTGTVAQIHTQYELTTIVVSGQFDDDQTMPVTSTFPYTNVEN